VNSVPPIDAAEGTDTRTAADPSNILIVDDNQAVTRALSVLVRDAGFRPVACHCGQDALAAIDRMKLSAAVIDIHLPDINGLVLSQKLRERLGPETPIIVVSGDTSMENLRSLQHVGATYFFPKPVNSQHLIEQLKEFVRGSE
jgi:DNA-binding response OmpR family regulator